MIKYLLLMGEKNFNTTKFVCKNSYIPELISGMITRIIIYITMMNYVIGSWSCYGSPAIISSSIKSR